LNDDVVPNRLGFPLPEPYLPGSLQFI
jgi:hypothetical protein